MPRERRFEAIKRITERLRYDPRNPELLRRRGRLLAAVDCLEQAINDFSVALSLKARYFQLYCDRARVRSMQGYYADALGDFNAAIRIAPRYAPAYSGRANVFSDICDFASAEESLDMAIALRPYKATYWAARAFNRFAWGRYRRALLDIREAIRLDPSRADYLVCRGYLRLGTLSAWEKARGDFDQAIKLAPGFMDARFKRGLAYFGLGEWPSAAKDFWYVLSNTMGSDTVEWIIWYFLSCLFGGTNDSYERLSGLIESQGKRSNDWPFGAWPEPVAWFFLGRLSSEEVVKIIETHYGSSVNLRGELWAYKGLFLLGRGERAEGFRSLELAKRCSDLSFPVRVVANRVSRGPS